MESINNISQKSHYNYIYPGKLKRILVYIYIILSFYEGYLNLIIGNYTRYFIFLLIIFFFFEYKRFKIQSIHWWMLAWLTLKITSILWGQYSYYTSENVLTQLSVHLGMVAFFIVMTMVNFDYKFIRKIVDVSLYTSFSMALLGLFFSKEYLGVESRRVLTILGNQIDPNNVAAFYLVGFSIALYYIIYEKNWNIKYFVILVINALGIALTGSRGGLVSLLAGIVALLFLSDIKKNNIIKNIKNLFLISLILSLIFLATQYFLPISTYNRLFGFDSYSSGSGRDLLWDNAMAMAKEKPFLGWGWGGIIMGVHNTFITMILEIGIVGILLFTFPILSVIRKAIKYEIPLATIILVSGLTPSFFIDGINKRFFWNAIIIATMLIKTEYKNVKN
ncbi:O-antigen ligase family protein [Neobacillus sp. NPDC093127]|uniref:O-antigen ligase family protein n=1 Tax=Neobacillus sp. NPDC093127 TaxID=3364296 RepID=UPI0037FE76FB